MQEKVAGSNIYPGFTSRNGTSVYLKKRQQTKVCKNQKIVKELGFITIPTLRQR